jgi:hypothetical protein
MLCSSSQSSKLEKPKFLEDDPERARLSTGRLGGRIPASRRLLHPLPPGLGEAHRVQAAAGNGEPIPFNRVGDAGSIGLYRAQVVEGLPTLRLAASRLIELSHDAKRRLFERANFGRASSAIAQVWVRELFGQIKVTSCATRHRA